MTQNFGKSSPGTSSSSLKLVKPCCIPHPLFEAKGLSVSIQGTQILKDISLQINKGCITSIVGPSGCGKSTFLLTISALLSLTARPEVSGSLMYRGLDLLRGSDAIHLLRIEVGILFQKPTPFPVSIWKNLELPLREWGIRSHIERQDRIELALKTVNLWHEVKDRLFRSALQLSGGQQQRLCLARALVLEPRALLMDEPTSSLDPLATEIIEDFIKRNVNRITVVLVTHNLAQARRLSNYIALFWPDNASTLIESGETEALFSSPTELLTRSYLRRESGFMIGERNA